MEENSLDYIFGTDLEIFQGSKHFRFSLDSMLIANYVKLKSNVKVLDLGSGNGIIPLILAYRDNTIQIEGIEVQKSVAELATRNILHNGLDKQINLIVDDLRNIDMYFENEMFDIVVSNPPYFSPSNGMTSLKEEYAYARHELNGSISDFVEVAAKMLKFRGSAYFVYNSNRLAEFFAILKGNNLEPKRIKFVHPKQKNNSNTFLLKATKGSKEGLIVEPSLIVYKNGAYTEELIKMVKGEY
ncbi:MAG: tRNA1(Val) (adenine(37)-N6)-methyltransferase [Clostridia bacterium]